MIMLKKTVLTYYYYFQNCSERINEIHYFLSIIVKIGILLTSCNDCLQICGHEK